jgi:hypothetical protein
LGAAKGRASPVALKQPLPPAAAGGLEGRGEFMGLASAGPSAYEEPSEGPGAAAPGPAPELLAHPGGAPAGRVDTGVQAGPGLAAPMAAGGAAASAGLPHALLSGGPAPAWVAGLGEGDAGAAAALEALRLKGSRRRHAVPGPAAGAPPAEAAPGRPRRLLTPPEVGPGAAPEAGEAAAEHGVGGPAALEPERAELEAAAARLRREAEEHAARAAALKVGAWGRGGRDGLLGTHGRLLPAAAMPFATSDQLCSLSSHTAATPPHTIPARNPGGERGGRGGGGG